MTDFQDLLSSPQFMMGLGLLANRGNFSGGLLGAQFANQQQLMAQKKAQQEARNQFLQGLAPEQQAYAQAFPNQFGQAYGNQMFAAPKDRKVIQGADGFNYYQDTGERVLPGVTKAPSLPTGMRMGANGPEWIPGYLEGKARTAPRTNVNVNSGATVPEYNKLPAGFVYKRDASGQIEIDGSGVPTAVPIKGGPSSPEQIKQEMDAKGEISPKDKKAAAQKRVTDALLEVSGLYNDLNKMGGAINVDNPTMENVWASIKASDAGQAVQRFVGTDEQSFRNQINQVRPTLINYIRQASEMGAKGMDSEKELEFFLQAVSDPKRDIQSNMAALKVLDDAYGLGVTEFKVDDSLVNKLKFEAKKSASQGEIKFLGFK